MSNKTAIGIDLGMTYSRAAVVHKGKVEIVENQEGNKAIPCFVAFNDTTRLYGNSARDQISLNPANTVYGEFNYFNFTTM